MQSYIRLLLWKGLPSEPSWKSARGKPIVTKGFRAAMRDIGLVPRRSDQLSHERYKYLRTRGWLFIDLCRYRLQGPELIVLLAVPAGPDDACQLVGHCHRRLVVTRARSNADAPLAQRIQRSTGTLGHVR